MSNTYTVRSGDTLSAIAARNHVSLAQLEAANDQISNPDLIHPGDRISVPGDGDGAAAPSPAQHASATPTTYQVASGNTLSGIAARYHTSVAALAERNHIANPDLIHVGDTIAISGHASARSHTVSGSGHHASGGSNASSDGSVRGNARLVAQIARQRGADPVTAVAMMLVESGGNERAVGDGGSSFGLFQLHRGGMLTAAGLSPAEAFDPATNARVAVASLARTEDQRGHSGGSTAAASQRPADPAGYARKVDAERGRAASLIA